MTSSLGSRIPPDTLLRIPQGADWAGIQIPIYDASGALRTSLSGCTAAGAIRGRAHLEPPLFEWSTTPSAGKGLITFSGGYVVVSVTGALSAVWTFRNARWQVDLTDPNAPMGQRVIRAGQGPLVVDHTYL